MALPFDYDAVGIIKAALTYLDWKPNLSSNTELKTRLFTLLNLSLLDLFTELPFTFTQHTFTITTQSDAGGVDGQILDRLTVADSARLVVTRSGLASSASPAGLTWDTTGRWSGRQIRIKDTSNIIHVRTIQDVWSAGNVGDYISLDEPLPSGASSPFTYTIINEAYPIPVQAVSIKHARLVGRISRPIKVATQQEYEHSGYYDVDNGLVGQPEIVVKGDSYALPPPNYTPTVVLDTLGGGGLTWSATNDPAGTFDYVYTHCFGRQSEDDVTRQGHRRPTYESNPSPVSSSITTTEAPGFAILLTTPNISRMFGYGPDGDIRDSHSGYYKRIYARRSATQTGASIHIVESPNKFFLVGECAGNTQQFVHDGDPAIDRSEPLRHRSMYQQIRLFPRPDATYTLRLTCYCIPEQLVNDNDVPPLPEESARLLLLKLIIQITSGMVDDSKKKAAAIAEYEELRDITRINYAQHQATEVRKVLASARRHNRTATRSRLGTVERS